MDVSMQLRNLAHAVGEDFAMNAPDDTSRLVGRARRGRMVWTTGVGTAVAASAATLAFGAPALADALAGPTDIAPAAPTVSQSTSSAAPTPSASPTSEAPTPSASATPPHTPGTIDLTGGASGSDDGPGHDVGDDNGGDRDDSVSDDGPGHDVGDDHGGDDSGGDDSGSDDSGHGGGDDSGSGSDDD